jgi:hypothetical protein
MCTVQLGQNLNNHNIKTTKTKPVQACHPSHSRGREAEIRRIKVQSQPGQIVLKTLSRQKKKKKKKNINNYAKDIKAESEGYKNSTHSFVSYFINVQF